MIYIQLLSVEYLNGMSLSLNMIELPLRYMLQKPRLKHQSSIIAPILAAFSASFARRGMLSTNPPMACLASLAHF
uniref:Uncharacterized protein n=1 Tax=Oryza meridionalis TaxID=40149 RepID=A0A0E0EBD1_9ORYZ